jgi:hypothetical protein
MEKISASCMSDKRLITRIFREIKKLTSQSTNKPLAKWTKELTRQLSISS